MYFIGIVLYALNAKGMIVFDMVWCVSQKNLESGTGLLDRIVLVQYTVKMKPTFLQRILHGTEHYILALFDH